MHPSELPPQFLTCRVIERPNGKTDKLPTDPRTGDVCNPHDSSRWVTYQVAAATGDPLAFVFTENDPFFLLDIDDCWDDSINAWSAESTLIAKSFLERGAGAEVSNSGRGLHIIASCDPALGRLCKNKHRTASGLGLEFYTTGRFVLLGRDWQGSVAVNCDDLITQIIPARGIDPTDPLPDGRDPDWSGPEDDDELIARMLRSQGGAARVFGDRASIADLWNADRLDRFFPASERQDDSTFDRSSADAALLNHLAFWTGKDAVRMDRLFRRSALMREKYEKRADYRTRSIVGAIRQCRGVLSLSRGAVGVGQVSAGTEHQSTGSRGDQNHGEIQPSVPAPGQNTTSVDQPGQQFSETISLTDIGEYFRGCVYIEDRVRVLCPDGAILNREQFRIRYGGHLFQMSIYETRPTKCPWEAFTMNRGADLPKVRTSVFRPEMLPMGITPDGNAVNVWCPPAIDATEGDVSPFLDLLTRMLPDKRDQQILLSWMAFVVQNPGMQARWAPVLQGVEGNGKTFFMSCMQFAVGEDYAHLPNPQDMEEKYNGYIENHLFIGVEEIHMEGRRSFMDRIKPMLTNRRVEVRVMGEDKRMVDNRTNWFFCTNHNDAIIKTTRDRRYAIFYTAQQESEHLGRDGLDGQYFPDLYAWAERGGYGHIAWWLKHVQIPDEFNPAVQAHRAPRTSSERTAIELSRGPMEVEILNAIEAGQPGFRGGYVSSVRAAEILRGAGMRHATNSVRRVLLALGFVSIGRTSVVVVEEGHTRPTLYATSSSLHADGYFAAQNYHVPI